MDFKQLVVFAFQASILLTVFAFGLKASMDDVLYLVRRPGLLIRSLLSMFFIVPALALVLVRAFELNPTVEIALLALAISPLPPLLPNKIAKAGGHASYAISLMLTCAALSVVFVPISVELLGRLIGHSIGVDAASVAKLTVIGLLIPFALGMLLNRVAPNLAVRLEGPISSVAKVVLGLAVICLLLVSLPAVWQLVGNGTILAIVLFVVGALIGGHLLGHPNSEESLVLAIASASRHPGIAVTISAASLREDGFVAAIILYLIVSGLVCLPYTNWAGRSVGRGAAPGRLA